ncbi:hypothetical protein [Phenylobacterium sp.]|uniref:hypothetical protein n=1 Tax=Phenylobacterium sp. TaxID=1871053 RepID=UPI002F403B00
MSYRQVLLTAAAASLMLAACNGKPAGPATGAPIASLPLAQSAPPPEVIAPDANQLPPAPPLPRLARPPRPLYSYVDDAYELGDAFADSPPDYTVDYQGERPWVWRSGGGEYRVVEQTPYGIREYFYRGDSDYPFLIRDTDYAYAYDSGELVEVFDSSGRPYRNYGPSQIDYAARYLVRGRGLYNAAVHEQRQAAYAADWQAHREAVLAPQRQWAVEQRQNQDWRRWREQSAAQPQPWQAALGEERTQRQAYVARTAAAAPMLAAGRQSPQARPDIAVERAQADAQRSRQADLAAQARGAQVQAETARAQADATRRGQAELAAQSRNNGQHQMAKEQIQAREQRRTLAAEATQPSLRSPAGRQAERAHAGRERQATAQYAQEAQAREQQHAQAQAAQHAQREAGRQQAAQVQAATRAAHDQQQAAAQHAQEAQAREQQHAQAQVAQHVQREAGRQQAAQAQAAARAAHDQQQALASAQRAQPAQAHQAHQGPAQNVQQAQAHQAPAQHAQQAQAAPQRGHQGKDKSE